MNKTLKSIGFLFILVLTGIQMYAQSGGALWVGSGGGQRMAIMQIHVPPILKGEESAQTLTHTEEYDSGKLTGVLTVRHNPDGKIVSISFKTPTPELVNPRGLETTDMNSDLLPKCPPVSVFCGIYWAIQIPGN
ncbi:MAG: hypothetical protein KDD99_28045 [Bacteroidetes bacterium]|nr:hypothetical protein [Bacteroidota bacterium]